MSVCKFYNQELEEEFRILKENENGWCWNKMLDDISFIIDICKKYGSIDNQVDLLPVDEVLAM